MDYTVNTAKMRNAKVIAADLAKLQQLNIDIAAEAVARDDDEPDTSNSYRDSTFNPFFDEDEEPFCPKLVSTPVDRPAYRYTPRWKLLERRDELKGRSKALSKTFRNRFAGQSRLFELSTVFRRWYCTALLISKSGFRYEASTACPAIAQPSEPTI